MYYARYHPHYGTDVWTGARVTAQGRRRCLRASPAELLFCLFARCSRRPAWPSQGVCRSLRTRLAGQVPHRHSVSSGAMLVVPSTARHALYVGPAAAGAARRDASLRVS